MSRFRPEATLSVYHGRLFETTVTFDNLRVETDRDNDDGLVLESHVIDDQIEQTDPGVVEFEAINRSEEPVRIWSGLPAPFGVLSGYRSGRPAVTLWSESYERENGVKTLGTTVTDVVEVGKSTTLERPGTGAVRN